MLNMIHTNFPFSSFSYQMAERIRILKFSSEGSIHIPVDPSVTK